MTKLNFPCAALVYQAGIANVFACEQFSLKDSDGQYNRRVRLLQGDFRSCEGIAKGLAIAGVQVAVFSCNRAGDVATQEWTVGLEDCPFREKAQPVTPHHIAMGKWF